MTEPRTNKPAPEWTPPDHLLARVRSGDGEQAQLRLVPVGDSTQYRTASESAIDLVVRLGAERAGAGTTVTVDWEEPQTCRVEEVLLPDVMVVGRGESLLLPNRMGQLLTPRSPEIPARRLRTGNQGLALFLTAALAEGAIRLLHWRDPAWELAVSADQGTLGVAMATPERGCSFSIETLPAADRLSLARRCREIYREAGWFRTWKEKVEEAPDRSALEGAAQFRALCFSRFVPGCMFNDGDQDELFIDYTFEDVEALSRHWKEHLGIDRALVMVCGWMRRGYDNQHPDVFPAAAECGGDEGLLRASLQAQSFGYAFGLHDNYHDMYPDAPSWDPDKLRRNRDGNVTLGGRWAGGQAALICSEAAIPLMERNLPEIGRRYRPNALYIDVIHAHPLGTCHHDKHPLNRSGDLESRSKQVRLAKQFVPIFGSEEGQGWGVADTEYFEGILSHYIEVGPKGAFPWFEWVFRDCIQLYAHAWDQVAPDRSEYIVRCLSLGRMPNYAFPTGIYYEQPESEWQLSVLHRHYAPPSHRHPDLKFQVPSDEEAVFSRGDQGWGTHLNAVDRFIKNTYEALSPVSRALVHEPMTGFRTDGPNGLLVVTEFGVATEFGSAGRIAVNEEDIPMRFESALLPTFGFVARTPGFLALHVLEWEGRAYDRPALFTIASLDGRPLETCEKARIYHGFGDPVISWRGAEWRVEREAIVEPGR